MIRAALTSSVVLAAIVGGSAAASDRASRPNVLLVLIDDLKPSIGAFGDETARTPNIDRLAEAGARFDRAYCNQAVCAPSRIHLMTGMRSTTSGIFGLSRDLRALHPNVVTLPQVFRANGYTAESIGKVFHVGHGSRGDRVSWSSTPWHESPIDYALIESTGGTLTREEALFSNWSEGDPWRLPKGAAWERADLEDDVYADGRIAIEASRRLEDYASTDGPFFLAVGFTNPHLPFAAPEKYWDMYDRDSLPLPRTTSPPDGAPRFAGKSRRGEIGNYTPIPGGNEPFDEELTRTLIHGYYASVSYVDAQIGVVLDALEGSGLADETVVVLWGDHGFHLGDLGLWTKHTNYEQANRIPLIIAGPGVEPSEPRSFAETVDVFPTLIDLADLPVVEVAQPIDGVSLVEAIGGQDAMVRQFARHDYRRGGHEGRAIRTPEHRLVEWTPMDGRPSGTVYELYDMVADPHETKNIAAEQPSIVSRLADHLRAERDAEMPKPLFADPNHHGSCDPEVVWNPATQQWLAFYTARRALAQDGNTPAGTPIGVAASSDWREWEFLGYCSFDGEDNQPDAARTYWAPGVVADGDELRMFVTYKPQATGFWGGRGEGIRHYVADASDPLSWRLVNLAIEGEDAIDAGLLKVGDEWLMLYRDKPRARGRTTFLARSRDLISWRREGLALGEVNDPDVNGHTYHEAQFPFKWRGQYWLLTDPSGPGLSAFSSEDGATWTFVNDFLVDRGAHATDSNAGRHPSVVVIDDRAFLFYHVEPDRPEGPYQNVPIQRRRTYLQACELAVVDGKLVAMRNTATRAPSPRALKTSVP